MSTQNVILESALHYAAQGFEVFPVHRVTQNNGCSCHKGLKCHNIGKHPAINGWPERATTEAEQIKQWFGMSYKDFNIGILMGSELVCLDVDVKEGAGKDGFVKLQALEAELGELPIKYNVQETPTGGRHYLYRVATSLGRHVTKDSNSPFFGLDVLGGPSFIVAAPSGTHKGRYSWGDSLPKAADIPLLPAKWNARLLKVCSDADKDDSREREGVGQYNALWADLPDVDVNFGVGEDELQEIRAALSWIPASGWEQDHSWFKIIGAIKSIANDRRGLELALEWSSAENDAGEQAEQYNGPDDVAYHFSRASGPEDAELNDSGMGSIFWCAKEHGYPDNGWPKHSEVNTDGDEEILFKVATLADAGLASTGAEVEDLIDADMVDEEFFEQYAPELIPAPKCLEDGSAMLGVLQHIQNYVESNNRSPQPALAALSALVTLSTLTRRSYIGSPLMGACRMNLMAVGVAPSGGGKDASLKGIGRVLRAVGLEDTIGRESKSGSAYHAQLTKSPNIVFTQDEIGKWFQYQQGQATHANTIKTFFLKVFTSSGDEGFVGLEYAPGSKTDSIQEVDYPHAGLYGVTTPDLFFETLTLEDIHDGLIGRLLICEATERPTIVDRLTIDESALDAILDFQRAVEAVRQPSGDNLQGFGVQNPKEVQIDEPALQMIRTKADVVRHKTMAQLDGYQLAETYARWHELVNKVACLMAIARKPEDPMVTVLEAKFAMEIVDYSCAKWVSVFKQKTADSIEGKIKKRLVKYLTDHPTIILKKKGDEVEQVMTLGVLRNRLSVDKMRFDSVVSSLTDGQMITVKGKKVWLTSEGEPPIG